MLDYELQFFGGRGGASAKSSGGVTGGAGATQGQGGGAGGSAGGGVDSSGFSDTDTADYHQLYNGRQYYNQQNLDIDARTALADYVDPNTTAGSLYNASQNMNYALSTGGYAGMNAQQKFMYDSITDSMHNLGYNVELTRYDHGGFVDDLLGGNHSGMSLSQLRSKLVGTEYSDDRILSTSYNNFKNTSNASTFTSREVKITYKAKADTQVLMPPKGSGGDFGEMLIGPTSIQKGQKNYKVVDVKYTGQNARAKGTASVSSNLKQLEIVVQI